MHPRNPTAADRSTPLAEPPHITATADRAEPRGVRSRGAAQRGAGRRTHRMAQGAFRASRLGLAALLLTLPLLVLRAPSLAADTNPFEQQTIEEQAKESYKRFIKLWQEELYFELYDLGISSTRERITREEFARRMVELAWVPDGPLNEKYLQADMRFRTIVYVQARVLYRHKFNPNLRFTKDQTVLLLMEDGQWHLDLIQLIRSPYAT